MLNSQCLEIFNKIERSFPVDRWECDGINLWPLIRIYGNLHACASSGGVGASGGRVGRLLAQFVREGRLVAGVLRDAFTGNVVMGKGNWSRRVDALFQGDGNGVGLVRLRDGVWYDRICDPLRERLTHAGGSSRMFALGRGCWPRMGEVGHIAALLHTELLTSRCLGGARPRTRTLPEFAAVARVLAEDLGWPLTEAWIDRHVGRVLAYARWYERCLHRLRPRAVFIVAYCGDEGFALCVSCRKLGIPVIEVQHGVQALHPAYNTFACCPARGWDMMPDWFWVWSEIEAADIDRWNGPCRTLGRHRPVVVGNIFLDGFVAGVDGRWREYVHAADRVLAGPRRLLITLQPIFDDEAYYRNILAIMDGLPADVGVWVRLHPEMRPKLEAVCRRFALVRRAVSVVEASQLPLYAVLSCSDVHLTHSSSSVLEAASFAVPSVVIDAYGAELFAEQIRMGTAEVAIGVQAATEAVVRALARAGEPNLRRDQATRRLERVQELLDELMGQEVRMDDGIQVAGGGYGGGCA